MHQPGFNFGFRLTARPAPSPRHVRRRRMLSTIDAAERRLWLRYTGHDVAYILGWIVPEFVDTRGWLL